MKEANSFVVYGNVSIPSTGISYKVSVDVKYDDAKAHPFKLTLIVQQGGKPLTTDYKNNVWVNTVETTIVSKDFKVDKNDKGLDIFIVYNGDDTVEGFTVKKVALVNA